tara:strand:+ start:211 stop:1104 length:894 start_codon:yes stop_codon:yes gene_type:complete
MEIVLFGTSSMVPTSERNHSATLLSYKEEKILIDCGEGTQRQFRKVKISPMKLSKILITHWHGDHILGLPGLIQTLGANDYAKELMIFGPKGTKKKFDTMFDFFVHRSKKIKYKVVEVEEGFVFENENYRIEASAMEHSTKTLAYAFIEKPKRRVNMDYVRKKGLKEGPIIKKLQEGKDVSHEGVKVKAKDATYMEEGKKFVIVTDTVPCSNAVKIAKDADILFCEATFLEDLKDKAKEFKHMTAKQAATIAKKANVKRLVLTHFSQRYKDTKGHAKEAKEIFENTVIGNDFQEFLL